MRCRLSEVAMRVRSVMLHGVSTGRVSGTRGCTACDDAELGGCSHVYPPRLREAALASHRQMFTRTPAISSPRISTVPMVMGCPPAAPESPVASGHRHDHSKRTSSTSIPSASSYSDTGDRASRVALLLVQNHRRPTPAGPPEAVRQE